MLIFFCARIWKLHKILHQTNPLSTTGLKALQKAIEAWTVTDDFLQIPEVPSLH